MGRGNYYYYYLRKLLLLAKKIIILIIRYKWKFYKLVRFELCLLMWQI